MSTDLYCSQIDENKHGALTVEMNVHKYLRIIAFDPGGDEQTAVFSLFPNEEGWKEAEYLISALQEWIIHSKPILEK